MGVHTENIKGRRKEGKEKKNEEINNARYKKQ